MDHPLDPPISPLELWRLSACASMAGIGPDVLDCHIREGGIPGCGIVEIGARRIRHVRRPDVFVKWLRGEHLPIEDDSDDLFADASADERHTPFHPS